MTIIAIKNSVSRKYAVSVHNTVDGKFGHSVQRCTTASIPSGEANRRRSSHTLSDGNTTGYRLPGAT